MEIFLYGPDSRVGMMERRMSQSEDISLNRTNRKNVVYEITLENTKQKLKGLQDADRRAAIYVKELRKDRRTNMEKPTAQQKQVKARSFQLW